MPSNYSQALLYHRRHPGSQGAWCKPRSRNRWQRAGSGTAPGCPTGGRRTAEGTKSPAADLNVAC